VVCTKQDAICPRLRSAPLAAGRRVRVGSGMPEDVPVVAFLANYTLAKSLTDAPDFRSPMFESAAPQNNLDWRREFWLVSEALSAYV
jgi:hypothetical protein